MIPSHAGLAATCFCAVLVTFPRSGTHLTLDFIRRNFAQFRFRPRFWQSSETLYVNLDTRTEAENRAGHRPRSSGGHPRGNRDHIAAASRDSFLVKTHDLPFAPDILGSKLQSIAGSRSVAMLYPFRRMSATLLSYQALCGGKGTTRAFLDQHDPFLGTSRTVLEAMVDHGRWGAENAIPIDVDDLVVRPAAYAEAFADAFGWTLEPRENPLPPMRITSGPVGELIERLRGRASTEVIVRTKRRPIEEAAFVDVDGPLAELHRLLKTKALSPA